MHLVCTHCLAVNRVPDERVAEAPKCGKCGHPVLPGEPVALNQASFDRVVERGDLPVVVDFWAQWCGPCRMMAPAFARAARDHATRVLFGKVDTDAEAALAQRYGIRSIPTIILFDKGREKARVSGAMDSGALSRWLAQNAA